LSNVCPLEITYTLLSPLKTQE